MKMYEEYKDSGVKWIGEVPSHWKIAPIKRFLSGMQDGTHGTYQTVDSGYPLLSAKNVFDTGLCIEDAERKISKDDYYSIIANGYPQKGDIALCCVGTIGRCCIYNEDVPYAFQRSVTFLRCNEAGYNSFFLYCLKSQVANTQYRMYEKTSAQSGIYMGVLKTLIFPIPTFIEQHHIAAYLDAKTEKIDKMIAKAEKKIEYLGELKQSLITRAVTRGLNPNAPLKDSGVKWIGKVPEHWEIMPFKYYGKLHKGLTFSKADLTATGVPVISYGQIHSKENKSVRFFEEGIRFIPRELTKNGDSALVKQGDFIFADTSEDLEGCGNCVYNDTTNPIYAGYHTIIYKTRERDCKYLAYLFRSNVWRSQIRCRVSGIKVYSITQGIMSQVNILLPPMSEQKEISTYLDIKCSKIDHIVATQKKKIAYLQELKQSLITNVVTGKIKVS